MKKNVFFLCHVFFSIMCLSTLVTFLLAVEDAPEISATIAQLENISSTSVSSEENIQNTENNIVRSDSDLQSSLDVHASFDSKDSDNVELFNSQVYVEATSQNSGIANEISNNGQPVVVTIVDSVTAELQQRAVISSQNDKVQINKNQTENIEIPIKINQQNSTKDEDDRSETNNQQTNKILDETPSKTPNDNLTEEIPSFSEWTQKRLEEVEKNKEIVNTSAQQQNINGNKQGSGAKFRWKNYASIDCGAKVVASNPEAVSPSAVLSPSRDEYKLNTCTSRIWFVVELCEAIQARKIDLANFELFSSSPKDFTVSVSDRFPTREWSNVGQFTAKDERNIQSFDLHPHLFGKYIKVEIKTHYGSEHYCPISLFRVYGTSEFEVLQKEDPVNGHILEDEDDDDDESLDTEGDESTKNLFSSATDAVISLVKKAAEVLGNKGNYSNQTIGHDNTTIDNYSTFMNSCITPSHLIVCDNCSDIVFEQIFQLLSCRNTQIKHLISIPWIAKALIKTDICESFGFDFKIKNSNSTENLKLRRITTAFFPLRYLGAMCNVLAIEKNKVVLNISNQYLNSTQTVANELNIINIQTSEPHIITTVEANLTEEISQEQLKDSLSIELTDVVTTKSSCSTDTSYVTQIKPTKALMHEISLKESNLPSSTTTTTTDDSNVVIATETILQSSDFVEKNPEISQTEIIESVDNLSEVEATTESVETLEDHLEHFISEFNGDSAQNSPNIPVATSSTPQAQKESVFLRLSNRIKVLERNMSLSGQYLEELSKRYKKQVEEMQKLFEKTLSNLYEDGKKKDDHNKQLEERVIALTIAVETLIAERNIWSSIIYFIIITVFVIIFLYMFCLRSYESKQIIDEQIETPSIQRRKSIDVITHSAPIKKTRRPSDQALKIVRSATCEEHQGIVLKENKRKKKKYAMKRSNSINTLSEETDRNYSNSESRLLFNPSLTSSRIWNRQKSAPTSPSAVDWVEGVNKFIEEVPFFLEESEHSTLEPLILSDKKKKIDTLPKYFKTAINSRRGRMASQNGPIHLNGNSVKNIIARKSVSMDETIRRTSPVPSVNGTSSVASSSEEQQPTPKKAKKSFKKMFKKVF